MMARQAARAPWRDKLPFGMRTLASAVVAAGMLAAVVAGCAGVLSGRAARVAASARALAIQPDGKIVAAGTASVGGFMSVFFHLAMARYHPDGRLDTGFGTDGTVLATEFRVSDYVVPTLALQPDGKVRYSAPSSSMTHRALAQEGPDLHWGDTAVSPL